ncbi:MAG TPA: PaaX family transcriptional regulator C-terminal domain-containing protein, partial [Ruminiclostridium sp.]|nr:PaaX family transcriptional regulator C-terminal domain-containing protein [Ruminiclostridium sp.]
GLENMVTILQGGLLYNNITPDKARSIWNLDYVNQVYENKWQWFTNEFQPYMRRILDKKNDYLGLFLLYLQLGEAVTDLYLVDPMLPREILPSNWVPKSILEEMMGHIDIICRAIPDKSPYVHFTNNLPSDI